MDKAREVVKEALTECEEKTHYRMAYYKSQY